MRKLALLIASGALAVAVLGSTAPSAQADCFNKHHPTDPSWITICDRERFAICDAQADDHYTWARYHQSRNPMTVHPRGLLRHETAKGGSATVGAHGHAGRRQS